MTNPLDVSAWLLSRAAGITAYVLLSTAIVGGLALALRLPSPRSRARLAKLHERLALLALVMIAAHGVLLLGDGWLNTSVAQLLVPFTMDYEPVFTGLGVLAFFVAALLALSFYARKRLGARRWRNAHRFIPIAWLLASVHALGAGTDTGSLWLLVPMLATVAGVVVLLVLRWTGTGRKPPARRDARAVPPVAT